MMQPSFRLDDQVAVVTGGGRGIGRTIAEGLAAAGADVALLARTESEIRRAADEIHQATGRSTLAIPCDVTKADEVERAVRQVQERFGKIDILINNAGKSFHGTALEISEEYWDESVSLNFKSVFLMSQAVGRHMVSRRKGRIVNIASPASVMTLSHTTSYGPAKAGVVHLTRQLAHEWGKYGITVNAVSPGWFKTANSAKKLSEEGFQAAVEKRIPIGRIGMLHELLAPVLFFCSEGASFCTGQHLFVDGGESNFGM
jgi:NAD(P)-dependent dehydrogenase (short-subunit alcohol dehydrogenase family)